MEYNIKDSKINRGQIYGNKNRREQLVVSVKRAMGIILPICMLSFLFVCVLCYVANDVYAFVKKDVEVNIFIDEPHTIEELAQKLKDENIINEAFVFVMYVKSKGIERDLESFRGNVVLDSSMSYREIVNMFS